MKNKKLFIALILLITLALANSVIFLKVFKIKESPCTALISVTPKTATDSLSYALGFVWAKNLARSGYANISPAFYVGVQHYFKKDSSVFGLQAAANYVNLWQDSIQKSDFTAIADSICINQIGILNRTDSFSFAVGYVWAQGAFRVGITNVSPSLLSGIKASFNNDSVYFQNAAIAEKYLNNYVDRLRAEKYAKEKQENANWLEKNKAQPDIVVLPSGLQYKIFKKGNGKIGKPHNIFECNYTARLIDGTIFDESENNKPIRFVLSGVMPGVAEAVLLMPAGSVWELYIPSHLAYGAGGIKDKVPPFSTVIYSIELTKVE